MNEAVIAGIGRAGRLVTSAALIPLLAFAALASGPAEDHGYRTGLRHPSRRDDRPRFRT
jgi:hypothetical protein